MSGFLVIEEFVQLKLGQISQGHGDLAEPLIGLALMLKHLFDLLYSQNPTLKGHGADRQCDAFLTLQCIE